MTHIIETFLYFIPLAVVLIILALAAKAAKKQDNALSGQVRAIQIMEEQLALQKEANDLLKQIANKNNP